MAHVLRPPSTQRLYDVCVVGSGLGGAVAGAILARRGYRVLHVDHDGGGGPYEDGGYLLPWAPAMFPPLRALPAAEACLQELGFTPDGGRAFEACAPGLQLLLPRHRLELSADPAHRAAELQREFRGDVARVQAALGAAASAFDAATPLLKALPPLPPDGFGERRALGKAQRSGGPLELDEDPLAALGDHPLAPALRFTCRVLGHLEGPPPPLAVARLLGGVLRGAWRSPAGSDGVRDLLRRRIGEVRGELLGAEGPPAIAESFDVDGSRIDAVRLRGSSNAFVARAFVAAADPRQIAAMLPEGVRRKLEVDAVRPSRTLLTLNLVVKAAALPPALADTAIAMSGDGEDDAVFLQVLPARRDTKKGGGGEAVADERVVCAATFVRAEEARLETQVAAHVARLRATLSDLLPFFERHLVRESAPMLAAPVERRAARALPHPLLEVDTDQALGVTGVPVRALKNLVFAGREVVPGLGLEGEFHAGVQAAAAAQGILGKRDLLR